MDGGGDDIAQGKEIKGAVVGDDRPVLPGGQPGCHHFLSGRGGVVAQPVQTTPHPDEPTAMRMVGKEPPVETAATRLRGREVAMLLRSDRKKATVIRLEGDCVTHTCNNTKGVSDMLTPRRSVFSRNPALATSPGIQSPRPPSPSS